MAAIMALALILLFFGLGGYFIRILWYVLIVSMLVWLIGFFIHAGPGANWYYW